MACEEPEKLPSSEKGNFMPYRIKSFNKISPTGLQILETNGFTVSPTESEPDAIVLRSHNLHSYVINNKLRAIARAGAGTNNVPVDKCTELGIPVFNAPGANANAVKELVLAGLLIASRNIASALSYSNTLKVSDSVSEEVEANKSRFKGTELAGKTLGVIGLGAIGVLVANDAQRLGMKVLGFDPYISVRRAWGLSSAVTQIETLETLLTKSDYVSIHVPLTASTTGFLDVSKLKKMKATATLLNFSRSNVVGSLDVINALDNQDLGLYVTDFPDKDLINHAKVISLPHLGASTAEAEENCSIMIAKQLSDFLRNGNIVNSVNFPTCYLEWTGTYRLAILNENKPNMVAQISSVLAKNDINITEMVNKSRDAIAYTLIDIDQRPSSDTIAKLKSLDGIQFVRSYQK